MSSGTPAQLTVNSLVGSSARMLTMVAGARGGDRLVSWAHPCELAEPWLWLSRGDLALTVGSNLPLAADAQRDYLERLEAIGVAGLVVAERWRSRLTSELLDTADRLGFPILEAKHDLHYSALVRTVAHRADTRVHKEALAARAQSMRAEVAAQGHVGGALIDLVASKLGLRAVVIDPATGDHLLRGGRLVPSSSRAPEFVTRRLEWIRPAELLISYAGDPPDAEVVDALTAVAAEELEHVASARRKDQKNRGALLRTILSSGAAVEAREDAWIALATEGSSRLAAVRRYSPDRGLRALYFDLRERGLNVACVSQTKEVTLLMFPDTQEAIVTLEQSLGIDGVAGLSEPFDSPLSATVAAWQARWALARTGEAGACIARHEDHRLAAFLPESAEARAALVDDVLGPILRLPPVRSHRLIDTLTVFVECNRSWKVAANRLRIHKQTLAYRIERVQAVAGFRLDTTDDLVRVRLALACLENNTCTARSID